MPAAELRFFFSVKPVCRPFPLSSSCFHPGISGLSSLLSHAAFASSSASQPADGPWVSSRSLPSRTSVRLTGWPAQRFCLARLLHSRRRPSVRFAPFLALSPLSASRASHFPAPTTRDCTSCPAVLPAICNVNTISAPLRHPPTSALRSTRHFDHTAPTLLPDRQSSLSNTLAGKGQSWKPPWSSDRTPPTRLDLVSASLCWLDSL